MTRRALILVAFLQATLAPAVLRAAAPQTGAAQARPDDDPFVPDAVLAVPGGPGILRFDMPGSELVALRLSVPLREGPTEGGTGWLLQRLGAGRAQAAAAPLGVEVHGARTPDGVAYTVVGTRPDFDFLAYLLREAVAEPRPSAVEFERVRLELHSEVLRAMETASGRVVAELRAKAAPAVPPLQGTVGSVDILTRGVLREVWRRSHDPGDMTVIVAGDVPDELLLSAFRDLGAPAGGTAEIPTAPAPPGSRRNTQVLRHWYGEAHLAGDATDPHATVAALLLSRSIREIGGDFEAEVQLWELDGRKVIALLGAAYPGSAVRMRSRIRSAVADTRQALDEADVAEAVAVARRDMLLEARTPEGLVTVVGRLMDASREPSGARRFLDALRDVTSGSVQAFLTRLETTTAIRAEVRP